MKKIGLRLGIVFISVCQVMSVALAQEVPAAVPPAATPAPAAPAPVVKKAVDLSAELSLFMEVYFVQLKAKAFDKAYASTSGDFKNTMKLSEFVTFANASRLTDFTSKMWFDKQWDEKTGLIVIKGDFVAGTETHTVTFQMMKKGDAYEILGITETLTLQLLASMFPKDAGLQALLMKDLSSVEKAVKRGTFRKLYNQMAKSARKNLKFTTFNKAMKAFRKEKKDISLPAGVKIVVAEGSPTINNDGSVLVKGAFTNGMYTVDFALVYSYEWEWKLSGLNINPVALAAAAGAAKVEEKK